MHEAIIKLIDESKLEDKKVITLYTCGSGYKGYASPLKRKIMAKRARYLGNVCCRGRDNYGLFAKIGGIAKKHPNEKDCHKVLDKIEKTIKSIA